MEVNKYSSFLNYIKYIINREDLEDNIEIMDLLIDSFKKDFNFIIPDNIDNISKKSQKSNDYEEFKELIENYNILRGNFQQYHYFYFNEKYKAFLGRNKMDNDGIIIKNKIKNKRFNKYIFR